MDNLKYSGFRFIGTPVNRDSRLFGTNLKEQKQINKYVECASLIWDTTQLNRDRLYQMGVLYRIIGDNQIAKM